MMIEDYVLNVQRWDALCVALGREYWIAQRETGTPGVFTGVEVDPSEWVAPLVNGWFVPDEYLHSYPVYVRVDGVWADYSRAMMKQKADEVKR